MLKPLMWKPKFETINIYWNLTCKEKGAKGRKNNVKGDKI